ncbi:hypothetical protein ACHAWF_010781 [Thalassiosira exigua]
MVAAAAGTSSILNLSKGCLGLGLLIYSAFLNNILDGKWHDRNANEYLSRRPHQSWSWEHHSGSGRGPRAPPMNVEDFMVHRRMEEQADSNVPTGETWEMVYVGVVLLLMFAALLSDRIGADLVMLAALTMCMAANIITVSEGLSGFSNEGVLTVLVLFVVAAGIQLTGGLDWYMNKLLGRPINATGAQLRLMVPISVISAFLNNTPVVVIMIPICQKWGKNMGISPAQLLVPLSFASILGGTCTLIGTSTNLVVAGLLTKTYPDDPSMQLGLFELGEFGVPILFIGVSYIIIASPYLLPGGKGKKDTALPIDDDGTILLGARLTKWSPAAGRTVKRSGLRDTGGVYLVSVYRARSGNIHRAVGQDFVLNADDILYFTGMVDGFGKFCENHGLEVVTNEVMGRTKHVQQNNNGNLHDHDTTDMQPAVTFASNVEVVENEAGQPGLLLDISRGLHNLGLQLHHTEASVIHGRSISTWRCGLIDDGANPDEGEMQAVLTSLLESEGGDGAAKRGGLSVIRAMVTGDSRLCNKTLDGFNFRETYNAAIIAVRKKDKSEVDDWTDVCFAPGDILVLQANDDSPLLVKPQADFYAKSETSAGYAKTFLNAVAGLKVSSSTTDLKGKSDIEADDEANIKSVDTATMEAWRDLRVLFHGKESGNSLEDGGMSREFLAAAKIMSLEDDELQQIDEKVHDRRLVQAVVARKGPLVGKTAAEVGFRTRYGAAVIAVHRDGTRVQDLPGNIKLHAGDVLLLEAGPTFISRNTDNQQSFALISEVKDSKPPRLDKLIPAVLLVLAMLVIVTIGQGLFPDQNMSSLLVCGLVTAIIMVSLGILSQQECRDAVNWEVFITIACAFGIGAAMAESGLASLIADGLVKLGTALGIGDAGLYGAVYLATFLISNIVTNNAAAALMFPIAIDAAQQTGADSKLMSYNLMLAASASFMSPFGYVKDFLYMGTPMQLILWILTTVILSNTTSPWWASWIWSSGVFTIICLAFVFPTYVKSLFNRANRASQEKSA